MRKKNLNRQAIIDEWLKLYPIRQSEFEINDEKQTILLVPHQENWLTKKILPKPKNYRARIKLDEIGGFIWQKCDGEFTISEICETLRKNFGERVSQTEERTVLFLQQMYKQKFIKVYSKKDANSGSS